MQQKEAIQIALSVAVARKHYHKHFHQQEASTKEAHLQILVNCLNCLPFPAESWKLNWSMDNLNGGRPGQRVVSWRNYA